jgi:uncharacterized membrane protein YczE
METLTADDRDLLTDADERALLGAREARIAEPLRVPGAAALGRWFTGLIPADRRVLRMTQLQAGLVAFGLSDAFMIMSGLGATPWDVFHQGLARHVGLAVGTLVILVGAAVMLLWIPLRQKPGFGTLSNVVVIGVAMNFTMQWVPTPHALWLRWAVLLSGILVNGLATGAYIGAGMGPGPRDGLMTGYAARGHSLRLVRTLIEVTVLVGGWLLGGTVGVGTALFAVAIGPLAHRFIPLFAVRARVARRGRVAEAGRRVVAPAPTLAKAGDC